MLMIIPIVGVMKGDLSNYRLFVPRPFVTKNERSWAQVPKSGQKFGYQFVDYKNRQQSSLGRRNTCRISMRIEYTDVDG